MKARVAPAVAASVLAAPPAALANGCLHDVATPRRLEGD